MARGPRIQISIPQVVYDDIKKRGKNFCTSRFFTVKYKEEFLNEAGIREHIKMLQERLLAISDEKVVKSPYDSKRCPFCNMFYQEDVSIRKKIHIYKSLYACAQCKAEQWSAIAKQVEEMKEKEGDKIG